MSKEEKNQTAVKAQASNMEGVPGHPGMPYPGQPGMPYPGQPGTAPYPTAPIPPYPTAPGPQPDYYPGVPYPGMELARAYFVIQRFGPLYDFARALDTGTLFPELYRPYPY